MNRRFLYDVLNFGIWLFAIFKNIFFLIVGVPLFLLLKIGHMNFFDFIEYARRKIRWRWYELKTDNLNLRINYKDGKLSSDVLLYEDEIKEISDQLNEEKHSSLKDFFDKTLQVAKKYMYIVYDDAQMSKRFIQFGLFEGTYIFELALTRENVNADYSSEVLKLLRTKGFKKYKNNDYPYRYKWYSIISEKDDLTMIIADCQRDSALATELAAAVFSKIFKSKGHPIARLG